MTALRLLLAVLPAFAGEIAKAPAPLPALPAVVAPAVTNRPSAWPGLFVTPQVPAALTATQALQAVAAPIKPDAPPQQAAQAMSAVVDGARPQAADAPSPVDPGGPTAAAGGGGGGPRLYVLSKTVDRTVKLGPVSKALHYGIEGAWMLGKGAVAWKVGGWGAAVAVTALELPRYPVSVFAQSLAHLAIKQFREKLKFLKELARAPEVTGLKTLTGSQLEMSGPFAERQVAHSLVLLEATGQPAVDEQFGAAVPLGDPARTRFTLTFSGAGATNGQVWNATLADVLAGKALPSHLAAAWTMEAQRRLSKENWLMRAFYSKVKPTFEVRASLVTASGEERDLGVLARGRGALKLARGRKGVPLSETRVTRGLALKPQRWLDALLGREIVVR